jgi:hypothetical protein
MSTPSDLEIHQPKYPTDGAHRDLNVIFPIERLQELACKGVVGGLTELVARRKSAQRSGRP